MQQEQASAEVQARIRALDAVGTVLKSGRTLTVCRLDVHAVSDGTRSLVATGQQTLICVNGPDE